MEGIQSIVEIILLHSLSRKAYRSLMCVFLATLTLTDMIRYLRSNLRCRVNWAQHEFYRNWIIAGGTLADLIYQGIIIQPPRHS